MTPNVRPLWRLFAVWVGVCFLFYWAQSWGVPEWRLVVSWIIGLSALRMPIEGEECA